ncbi:MAG: DUF3054 domain-containing protein [Leucobacter sp.]
MSTQPAPRPAPVVLAAAVDAALVILFAALGRSEHAREATLPGLAGTAWPFLAGLAVMWIAALVWRRPFAVLRSGVPLWLGSVAIGMLLRALTGGGIALPFVIVATAVLGAFLLGWRAIVAISARVRRRRA